jgi:hypothetical protein
MITLVSTSYTVTLPNPQLGNNEAYDIKTRFLKSMAGQVHSYVLGAAQSIFLYVFNNVSTTQLAELINVITNEAGETLVLTDWNTNVSNVKLTQSPLEIIRLKDGADACDYHSFQLELQVV